jgi:hypothetical protein
MSEILAAIIAVLVATTASAARSFNYNETSVKGLFQALGYVSAQDAALGRIETLHPQLGPGAMRARLEFAVAFPDVNVKLVRHLTAALGAGGSGMLAEQMRAVSVAASNQSYTLVQADEFVRRVSRRAAGEIESPILAYLLAVTYLDSPVSEFRAGHRQRYSTDGSGKAQGLMLEVSVPKSWRAMDGTRPHVVQKWTSQDGTGLETIALQIRQGETPDPSRERLEGLVRTGEIRSLMPASSTLLSARVITIETLPALWIESTATTQRVDTTFQLHQAEVVVYFRGKAIVLTCSSGGRPGGDSNPEVNFPALGTLFGQVVNSLVLPQVYGPR